MTCELCQREIAQLTLHHLIPKQKTRRQHVKPGPTIQICGACHRQIHHLFDNTELARNLNSAAALRNHPDMAKFLAWVRKQDPGKRIKVY